MKKIITTPAGRKNNLEILYLLLKKRKNEFDTWNIWVNTKNNDDLVYMQSLAEKEDWIFLEYSDEPFIDGPESWLITHRIYNFMNKKCKDKESMYLRLDDDICFIEKGAITKVFDAREKNKTSILVYGTVINNAVIQYHHQKNGILSDLEKVEVKDYFCPPEKDNAFSSDGVEMWQAGQFTLDLHRRFIEKFYKKELEYFYIENFFNKENYKISVNVVAIRGDLNYLLDENPGHEEYYFAVTKPKELGISNEVVGNALFCHYSFNIQKDFMDKTEILDEYRKIALEG